MKIAAIVILYHPGVSLLSNLNSYYNGVDVLYIFDNTEEKSSVVHQLSVLPKVVYLHDGLNEGIAKRLNQGMEKAIENECQWVLTMDQDSYFSTGTFSQYLQCFNAFKPIKNVAMFGPVYGRTGADNSTNCQAAEIHELITSGTLLHVDLYSKTGPFDEALFIDSVDHDYCIRSIINGHSLIQFSNIYLLHQLGSMVRRASIKSLFLVKKTKAIHSPFRCYYMYRNLIYLEKKYAGQHVSLLQSLRETAFSNITNCVFYGRDTVRIAQYLIAAQSDFKKGIMGKCTHRF